MPATARHRAKKPTRQLAGGPGYVSYDDDQLAAGLAAFKGRLFEIRGLAKNTEIIRVEHIRYAKDANRYIVTYTRHDKIQSGMMSRSQASLLVETGFSMLHDSQAGACDFHVRKDLAQLDRIDYKFKAGDLIYNPVKFYYGTVLWRSTAGQWTNGQYDPTYMVQYVDNANNVQTKPAKGTDLVFKADALKANIARYPISEYKAIFKAAPAKYAVGDEVTCYAGSGPISSVGSDPTEEGYERTYQVDLRLPGGGGKRASINENSLTSATTGLSNKLARDRKVRTDLTRETVTPDSAKGKLDKLAQKLVGSFFDIISGGVMQERLELASIYPSVGGFVFTFFVRGEKPNSTILRSFLHSVPEAAVEALCNREYVLDYQEHGEAIRLNRYLNTNKFAANDTAPAGHTPKFQHQQRVSCYAGSGYVLSIGTVPKKGEEQMYYVQLDGARKQLVSESALSEEVKVDPDEAAAAAKKKAKAKFRFAALAQAAYEEALAPAPIITASSASDKVWAQPDYDLTRTPGAWDIPEAWGRNMPAQQFAFLKDVNERQRVVGGSETKARFNPVKNGKELYGITSMRVIRELLELSTVHLVRTTLLPLRRLPESDFRPFLDRLITLYQRQFSLAELKTTTTLLNQQYSTPGPISGILGEWIARKHPKELAGAYEGLMQLPGKALVLEPTAGNGLLTTRFDPRIVAVNELEATRLEQLRAQPFFSVTPHDATNVDLVKSIGGGPRNHYLGVITNPPFGTTGRQHIYHRNGNGAYHMTGWEHVIAAHAVSLMADNGRAAIIIGGHDKYDEHGRREGKDWTFFNWIYSLFAGVKVFNLDAKKLYARQGATWPIRIIVLDGCGTTNGGRPPRGEKDAPLPLITSFYQLAQELGLISTTDA